MFKKWFAKGEVIAAYLLISATNLSLVWDDKHALPVTDWAACEPDETISDEEKNQHWSDAAASWLKGVGFSRRSEIVYPLRPCSMPILL